jgi:hypothetical protein
MNFFLLFHEMRKLLRKQNSVVHLLLYGQEPHSVTKPLEMRIGSIRDEDAFAWVVLQVMQNL